MHFEKDEAPIRSDAYIDALLGSHARLPIPLAAAQGAPSSSVRQVIRLLENGLPRFHPSFLFEEHLAAQLRAAAGTTDSPADLDRPVGSEPQVVIDRRLLMGGALASGFSIGAAAMLAWRRRHE